MNSKNILIIIIILLIICIICYVIYIIYKRYVFYKLNTQTRELFKHIEEKDIKKYYDKNKIIISLTTSPSRILLMEPVINSMLNQSYSPHLIRINIPKIFKRTGERYDNIPSFIINNPKIKIFEYEEDYGPIMKCLPTLMDYKNEDNIIVIYGDDDVLFLPKTIETYLKFMFFNSQNIYCLSGFNYINSKWIHTSGENITNKIDIPEGFMTVCLKSKILKNNNIFNYYNLIKENKDCFQSDDFTLGNFFKLTNIDTYIINTNDVSSKKWWSSGSELKYGNSGDGLKDINIGGHEKAYERCSNFLIEKKLYSLNVDVNEKIPLKIYTTWNTKDLAPSMKKNLEKLKNDNPEFEVILYDNNDCQKFIIDNFDNEVLKAYDSLMPHSYKSDLWRYCVLYINGGVYIDIKFRCINDFKLIDLLKNNEDTWVQDNRGSDIYTGLIICKKHNPILLKCINSIVENVKEEYYGPDQLFPTGPGLLGKQFTTNEKNNMKLRLLIKGNKICIIDKNNNFILDFYPEYRNEQKIIELKEKTEHYSISWEKKKIYKNKNMENVFVNIYENNEWGNNSNTKYNGSSGEGSDINYNKDTYVPFLKKFITDNKIKNITDLGCGDFRCGKIIYDDLDILYTGYDTYKKVIDYNSSIYSFPKYSFIHLDFCNKKENIKDGELCILKDVLQHWCLQDIYNFLDYLVQYKKFKYILICNCCNQTSDNTDIKNGDFRPLSCDYFPLRKYNSIKLYNYHSKEVSLIHTR